jgi:nucleotide-binding universal stress UspA family protein
MSVVVGVDGSDASTRAARAGLELLGDVSDAVIVTVVDAGDPMEVTGTGMAGGTISADEFDERERVRADEGSAIVSDAAAALGMPGAETRVLRGDPAAMLCELAETLPARAIVIGSRGRGAIKRAFLGSVSDHVVRNAPCPVVVTGEPDDETAG